jgi:hypothetical protein
MLGKHQRGPAMADREVGFAERAGALRELLLQRPVLHLVNEVERPWSDLRLAGQGHVLRRCGEDRDEEGRGDRRDARTNRHGKSP